MLLAIAKRGHRWKKTLANALIWFAVAGAVMVFSTWREQLGVSTATIIIIVALFYYVQYRLDRIEERSGMRDIEVTEEGNFDEPIEVQEVAVTLPDARSWGVTDNGLLFMNHFQKFGAVLNDYLDRGPWRLQEKADTEVSGLGDWGPRHGRQYDIYLGKVLSGRLKLTETHDYSLEKPSVNASIELWTPRIHSFDTVTELLDGLASHVGGDEAADLEQSYQRVRNAMLATGWQVGRHAYRAGGMLTVHLQGTARWYLQKAGVLPRERTSIDDWFDEMTARTNSPAQDDTSA